MLRTFIFVTLLGIVSAENGSAGWLRYSRLPNSIVRNFDPPSQIITLNASSSNPVYTAGKELENGLKGLFGRDVTHLWDNMDGTIERGYGGLSFFFANAAVLSDLTRATEYACLLASIKINGVILTNVNADPVTLTPENIKGLGRIGDVMRPYGIQIGIAFYFASPQTLGGPPTFDPLDESVISWCQNGTAEIYSAVPDFGGYLVKANSEGQPGPLTYNRTLAQGANILLNISDWKADREAAAYEAFQRLDGAFKDNAIVHIKVGPLDFQVREPASPLFGYLRNTNVAIELPVTQEYLGQQSHTVYLPPLWKFVLDTDLRVDNESSRVSDIVGGRRFKRQLGGFAGMANAGSNATWMGSHMAMSNLYAYGRIAWNPDEGKEIMSTR
ncbi:hypothetical protein ZTR_07140 [Talaromyces verruculosus]|nr:hypothetical protein ZTR_07140 [Talaromyces verruculosus]